MHGPSLLKVCESVGRELAWTTQSKQVQLQELAAERSAFQRAHRERVYCAMSTAGAYSRIRDSSAGEISARSQGSPIPKKVREAYAHAVALDPDSVDASGAITELNLAIAFRMRNRWPPIETPMSFSIWSSIWPSRSIPISLASKASAYWASPIPSSHLRISLMARAAPAAPWRSSIA
jgi:hypothetical protein